MNRLRKWLRGEKWFVLREEMMGKRVKVTCMAPSGTMWAIWGSEDAVVGWQAVY